MAEYIHQQRVTSRIFVFLLFVLACLVPGWVSAQVIPALPTINPQMQPQPIQGIINPPGRIIELGLLPVAQFSEVDFILPRFDCSQDPTSPLCCAMQTKPNGTLNTDGCCQARNRILSARKSTSIAQAGSPDYDQIMNKILKEPFSAQEHNDYVNGCCSGLASKDHTVCCVASMMGGDLSACSKINPSPPSTPLPPPVPPLDPNKPVANPSVSSTVPWVCVSDGNSSVEDGKQVVTYLSRDGSPSQITLRLEEPQNVQGGLGALLVTATSYTLKQTAGTPVEIQDKNLGEKSQSGVIQKSLNGRTMGKEYVFSAPVPDRKTGSMELVFEMTALDVNQTPLFASKATCLIKSELSGGGCGCQYQAVSSGDSRGLLFLGLGVFGILFCLRHKNRSAFK